jgi:CheY-like chemotaxis protein
VDNGNKALAALKSKTFDCMVLDLMLPDISGFKVLEQIEKIPAAGELPIIIYTGKSLTKKEVSQLEKFAKRIVVKGVQSPERLLNEVTLFLHQVASKLPKAKRKILEKLYQTDTVLAGKKVLVVDDDMRNIFALTSILERHQLLVMSAENGKEALKLLENTKDVDAILMDIMMPEMDGYETTRNIRKMANFKNIPIIALTAKAMKGDREKCLEAGASDYISKPVNMDQLLSLLRVWLYK